MKKDLRFNQVLTFILLVLFLLPGETKSQKINLTGNWQFAMDPSDKGITEAWFNTLLSETIVLPGSMTSNGKGEDITLLTPWTGSIIDRSYFKSPDYEQYRKPGNIKVPFWLQPLKYYKGAAWYQKEVIIPESWKGQNIELFLERCHWESRLWIDGKEAGMQNSLGTPHRYNLTQLLTPGKHIFTLCIDNREKIIQVGVNSHSISDHTQTNWNGIIGEMYLIARPQINITSIQVFPDIKSRSILVKTKILNTTGQPVFVKLNMAVTGSGMQRKILENLTLQQGENYFEVTASLGNEVKLWDEFHPNMYNLEASLTEEKFGLSSNCSTQFGMREFKVLGGQLTINGRPLFLRGTLECAIFPKTGFPPTDVAEWLRIFNICRAHGLNHMRFHSWCPPQAAFDAADQTGFYLQVECSSWNESVGDGKPFDKYLYEESQRMVDEYGNHPSFCMMAYGNEPGGKNQEKFLGDFVSFWKSKDSRRMYTSAAGWPILAVNDYLSTPDPRIQGWGQGLKSIINGEAPRTDYDWSGFSSKYTQPVVSHEIGQWCVYPNFNEIPKYNGVLKAHNFEIFHETLKNHGMAQLADSFLLASGKLQALCYKADIEAALRTPGFGGFQLLDLHDFPGQGTALVGVLDPFWDEKGYISPAEYKRFCNSTVPLARMKKLIFTNDEAFEASAEVAHYGDAPIKACTPEWKITGKNGRILQIGKLSEIDIPQGNCSQLGKVSFPLATISNPEKLTLEISVNGLCNSWDFWVYPAKKATIEGEEKIRIVQTLDAETEEYLKNGGCVLLTLKKGSLTKEFGGSIKVGFSSIFWNTAWTGGQPPHTLGILCNPKHPALAEFPTEYYSNFQWWDAMSNSGAINLTSYPAEIKPIVRVIDDWFTNRPLALIFEARVGKGRIIVSGIDLVTDLDSRSEAKQLQFSLKSYMASPHFNPVTELNLSELYRLYE